jgi:hypothetical protein
MPLEGGGSGYSQLVTRRAKQKKSTPQMSVLHQQYVTQQSPPAPRRVATTRTGAQTVVGNGFNGPSPQQQQPQGFAGPGGKTYKSLNDIPLDDAYSAGTQGLDNQLSQYLANYGINTSRTKDNLAEQEHYLGQAQTDDLRGLLNSYAGRGVVNSSSYGYQFGDTERQYGDRRASIEKQSAASLADLARQLSDFKQNIATNKDQLKAEAIARRAATYGSY